MSLRRKAFAAVRWTIAGTVMKFLLQVGQIAVLARVLPPEDFGLMAIVVATLSFAAVFSDFGVNSAFVQRRDVSEEQRSNLFWFNVLVSAGLMLITVGLSPFLSVMFGDDRLTLLISLSSSIFIITAFGAQVRMAAEKALFFRGVMVVEVCAAFIGFGVAIWSSLLGWGVYSLAAAAISNSFFSTLFAWIFLSQGWRPQLSFDFYSVRSFLGFGGAVVANNVLSQINLTIDLFLGARMLAAAQLGLYSVPRDLVLRVQGVVNPIITRIAFPLISEVQREVNRVRNIYLQTLNMTASTNAPVYIAASFFSEELIAVFLGDGWRESAEILKILAIWGAVRSIGNPVGTLLLGMGRADLSFKWNLSVLVILPPAIWFGSMSGPNGLAAALLGVSIFLFIPAWFFLVRPLCHVELLKYVAVSLRPLLISLVAIIPAWMVADVVDDEIYRLTIGLVVAAPIYGLLSYWLNRSWVISFWSLIGQHSKP